jgi:TP901 family phage tail tape measure protein
MPAMETMLRLVISGDSKGAQKALKDVEAAAKGAGGSLDAPSQKLGLMGDKMVGAGKSMSMGVTLPLLAVGAVAVNSAAKFETSMNQVQAASGASSAELDDLSEYAKQMGADTVFSAGEAADAMLELAKSGMTPVQIKAGGLKATMDLAAAGNLALADAATITSNAMNTFSLEAKDAATVAAALAGGANASSADVSDLALALSQVGPGAKTAGLSLQETVAVLAEFADKGIRGSDAGTSLKTMLTRLVPTTDKAAGMMAQLGIDFTNADGSMKSIAEVAEILQEKMGGLSDEQKTLAMNVMFGSDATRAATILMQGGAEGLEKYTKATNDQSAATDMAEARMKGLGGALENMKGSLETAAINIGEVLAPMISKAAGAIKWLADGLSGMPKWLQTVVVGVGLLVAAIGPLLVITGKVLTGFQSIRNFSFKRQMAGTSSGPGNLQPGSGSGPLGGTTQASTAAEQRNTAATNLNTQAQQRSTAAANREAAASNREAAADSRSVTASNLETAADRRSAGASTLAGTRIGTMGGKAKGAAVPIGQMGTASGRARGSILGMDKSAVKSAATFAALAIAVTFTMNQLSKLGNAIDSMNQAADQAGQARAGADKALDKYMAKVAAKYGKDSPEYRKALEYEKQQRAAIARDAYKMPWWASAAGKVKGGISSGWNWAFGGGQAAGGDYMVTRPTLFLAGEAGPERATFTPQGKAAPGGGGLHLVVNIGNLNGTDEQAARMVAGRVGQLIRQQQLAVAVTGY